MFKARLVLTLFFLVLIGVGATYAFVSLEHAAQDAAAAPGRATAALERAELGLAHVARDLDHSLAETTKALSGSTLDNPRVALKNAAGGKADLLWWVDAQGVVKARLDDETRSGDSVRGFTPVAAALNGQRDAELLVVAGKLLQVVAIPLVEKGQITGALVAGATLDVQKLGATGAVLALALDGSILTSQDEKLRPVLEEALRLPTLFEATPPALKHGKSEYRVAAQPFPFATGQRFSGLVVASPVAERWIPLLSEQTRLIVLGGLVFFVLGGLVTLMTSNAVRRQSQALAAQVQMIVEGKATLATFNRRGYYKELDPLLDAVFKIASQPATPNPTTFPALGSSTMSALPSISGFSGRTAEPSPAPAMEATGSRKVMDELTQMVAAQTKAGMSSPANPTIPPAAPAPAAARPVEVARPVTPPHAAPAHAPMPSITMASSPSLPTIEKPIPDDENVYFDQVFRDYLGLRERLGQPTNTVNREKFLANLSANAARIKTAKGCAKVRYTVFEKDGTAQVKASAAN